MFSKSFSFTSNLKRWNEGKGAWFYVTMPVDQSQEIKANYPFSGKGFGTIPVKVNIGQSRWKTSLFPSKELSSYILFIKKQVRTAESISPGDSVHITITVSV